jgi:hypothetical protein
VRRCRAQSALRARLDLHASGGPTVLEAALYLLGLLLGPCAVFWLLTVLYDALERMWQGRRG